jgi:alpha-1,6-mannosyltransferase
VVERHVGALAVVREVIANPLDPAHPQVLSAATHPGYSPYTVAIGVVARWSGANALAALAVAAVVNVALTLAALHLFVIRVTDNRRAPFWMLPFALTLWGFAPYRYSGFLGLNSIGFVAPTLRCSRWP